MWSGIPLYVANSVYDVKCTTSGFLVRKAAKKVPPLVVRQIRGGVGCKGPTTLRKNNFFKALKTKKKKGYDDHLAEEVGGY